MAFNLASLAPLAGLQQGWMGAQQFNDERQQAMLRQALNRLALQQAQQQQQAMGLAGQVGGNIPSGPIPLPQSPQQLPQVPNYSSAMGGPGVKGSVFGNFANYRDPSDSGATASGAPTSVPGIALRIPKSSPDFGKTYDITTPEGRHFTAPQTDYGPAPWTGRGVDISAGLANQMYPGGDAQKFPTDSIFHVQLAQDLSARSGAMVKAGVPLPAVRETAQTAQAAAQQFEPQQFGRSRLPEIWQAIEGKAPDADPVVKFLAAGMLQKLMAPEDQMAFKLYAQQNQNELRLAMKDMQIAQMGAGLGERERHDRAMEDIAGGKGETAGWQFITRPDGSVVRAQASTGRIEPVDLPSGSGKMTGTKGASPLTETQAKYWAKIVDSGGALPPGVARNKEMISQIMGYTASGAGDPGEFIAKHATVQADARSLANMTKMTDAAESFERTANANLDNALRLSKNAVPTDLGPFFNKWVETGQTAFGGTNVPPYLAAVLTAANEYAKIMNGSTGSQGSTVDSRREAAEMLSPYLSAAQITEVAKVLKQDMTNRKRELYGQVEDIRGRLKASPATTGGAAPQGQPLPSSGGQNLDVTEEQYNALPKGSVYTIPGDPTPRIKP